MRHFLTALNLSLMYEFVVVVVFFMRNFACVCNVKKKFSLRVIGFFKDFFALLVFPKESKNIHFRVLTRI